MLGAPSIQFFPLSLHLDTSLPLWAVGYWLCAVTGPALLSSFHLHLPALCPVPVTSLLGERQQRTEAKRVDVGGSLSGSESQLYHLLAVWPQAAYLTSLSFTSLIYRKGVIIIPL